MAMFKKFDCTELKEKRKSEIAPSEEAKKKTRPGQPQRMVLKLEQQLIEAFAKIEQLKDENKTLAAIIDATEELNLSDVKAEIIKIHEKNAKEEEVIGRIVTKRNEIAAKQIYAIATANEPLPENYLDKIARVNGFPMPLTAAQIPIEQTKNLIGREVMFDTWCQVTGIIDLKVVVEEIPLFVDNPRASKQFTFQDFLMQAPQLTYADKLLGAKCLVSFRGTVIQNIGNKILAVAYHHINHIEYVKRAQVLKAHVAPVYDSLDAFLADERNEQYRDQFEECRPDAKPLKKDA